MVSQFFNYPYSETSDLDEAKLLASVGLLDGMFWDSLAWKWPVGETCQLPQSCEGITLVNPLS